MSWQPDIWIKKEDYLKYESQLKNYNAWEFNIAGVDGIVLSAGEMTSSHRDMHDIIEDTKHWILNSECRGCDNCVKWGEQINEIDE